MVLYKGQKIDSFSGAVPAKLTVVPSSTLPVSKCVEVLTIGSYLTSQAMLKGLPERIPGFKGPRIEA